MQKYKNNITKQIIYKSNLFFMIKKSLQCVVGLALLVVVIFLFQKLFINNTNAANGVPIVTSISPDFGPTTGGNEVVISGSDFFGDYDFEFDLVVAGGTHAFAFANDSLYAWGDNTHGQLSIDNSVSIRATSPVNLSQPRTAPFYNKTITAMAGGSHHSVVVADGELYTFGRNDYGQLGDGTFDSRSTPVSLSANQGDPFYNKTISSVAAGQNHTFVVADGELYVFGINAGQLGDNRACGVYCSTPVNLSAVGKPFYNKSIDLIALGDSHSMVVADGELYTFGSNTYGQLGRGNTTSSNIPINISAVGMPFYNKTITNIAAGSTHSLVVADDELYVFGQNDFGQLGNGNIGDSSCLNSLACVLSPINLSATSMPFDGKSIGSISGGASFSLVLADGQLYAFGNGAAGQLGNGVGGSGYFSNIPINLSSTLGSPFYDKTITNITTGRAYSLIQADGQLYSFGSNNVGQIGDGNSCGYNYCTTPQNLCGSGKPFGTFLASIIDTVKFDGIVASSSIFSYDSDTSITVIAPPHARGATNITLTTVDGQTISVPNITYTYKLPLPIISSINPSVSPVSGGLVEITGKYFLVENDTEVALDSITFDGVPCRNLTVTSFTTATCITEAHAAGHADVVTGTTDGQFSLALIDGYTFGTEPDSPIIEALEPSNDSVIVIWNAPEYDGYSSLVSYELEVSTNYNPDGGGVGIATGEWTTVENNISPTTTAYIYDTNGNNEMHYFRVYANNSIGKSLASNVLGSRASYVDLSVIGDNNGNIQLSLSPNSTNPEVVSTKYHTVSFASNHNEGIYLTLSTNVAHNNLVDTTDSLTTISGINSSGEFDINATKLLNNTWGFAIPATGTNSTNINNNFDNTYSVYNSNFSQMAFDSKWASIPNKNDDVLIIKSTNIANDSAPDNTDVFYGVRANALQPAGIYKTTVVYTTIGRSL